MTVATIRNLDETLPKIKAPKRKPTPRKAPTVYSRAGRNEAMAIMLASRADFFFDKADKSSRSNHWNYATIYRMFGSRLEIARNAADPENFIRNLQKIFQSLSEELGMIADDLHLIAETTTATKADK